MEAEEERGRSEGRNRMKVEKEVIDYESRALVHAEEIGVIEYKVNGSYMEYWSFFGNEGFYFVRHDLDSGEDVFRGANIPWDGSLSNPVPAFLVADGGGLLYNYLQG